MWGCRENRQHVTEIGGIRHAEQNPPTLEELVE